MKIIADKEGIDCIRDLCNLALKAGGIQNLDAVNEMMDSIEIIKKASNEDDEHKKVVIKKEC